MARNFKELEEKMSPEVRASVKARVEELRRGMRLSELREACEISPAALAKILKRDPPEVSRIENRTDMYVSTLASYIEAMGGSLEICAVFSGWESQNQAV